MPSETSQKPNLFLVGSMKCGTTSLHNYLAEHPQVFMTQDPWKEPAYFVDRLNWNRGEQWYCDLFRESGKAPIRGESSTDYTKFPHYRGVAERIARFSPGARILYLMRDPVERTISHYWWEVQWSAEGRDMLKAIRRSKIICDVSYYAMQLREYLPLFERDRILVLTTEELRRDPRATLTRVFDWLQLDASLTPTVLNQRHNVSPEHVRRVFGAKLFSYLHGGLLWKATKRVVPSELRQRAMHVLSRPVPRDNSGLAATVRYLRPIQRAQTDELSSLLGREFPEWTTLYGDEEPG